MTKNKKFLSGVGAVLGTTMLTGSAMGLVLGANSCSISKTSITIKDSPDSVRRWFAFDGIAGAMTPFKLQVNNPNNYRLEAELVSDNPAINLPDWLEFDKVNYQVRWTDDVNKSSSAIKFARFHVSFKLVSDELVSNQTKFEVKSDVYELYWGTGETLLWSNILNIQDNICYGINKTVPSLLTFSQEDWDRVLLSLQEIIIPEGVVEIFTGAFEEEFSNQGSIKNANRVIFPWALNTIDDCAFKNCTNLTFPIVDKGDIYGMVIDFGLHAFPLNLGKEIFYGCSSITGTFLAGSFYGYETDIYSTTAFCIPDGSFYGTSIEKTLWDISGLRVGQKAFKDCYSLESSQMLTSSPAKYDISCYENSGLNATSRSGKLSFGSATEHISENAFKGIKELNFEKYTFVGQLNNDLLQAQSKVLYSLTEYNGSTWCFGLNGDYNNMPKLPNTDLVLATPNYWNNPVIPPAYYGITEKAFENCENLKDVTIGVGYKYINRDAFARSSIESATFLEDNAGSNLVLEQTVFAECYNLTSVTLNYGSRVELDGTIFENTPLIAGGLDVSGTGVPVIGTIYVPSTLLSEYETYYGTWYNFAAIA